MDEQSRVANFPRHSASHILGKNVCDTERRGADGLSHSGSVGNEGAMNSSRSSFYAWVVFAILVPVAGGGGGGGGGGAGGRGGGRAGGPAGGGGAGGGGRGARGK